MNFEMARKYIIMWRSRSGQDQTRIRPGSGQDQIRAGPGQGQAPGQVRVGSGQNQVRSEFGANFLDQM